MILFLFIENIHITWTAWWLVLHSRVLCIYKTAISNICLLCCFKNVLVYLSGLYRPTDKKQKKTFIHLCRVLRESCEQRENRLVYNPTNWENPESLDRDPVSIAAICYCEIKYCDISVYKYFVVTPLLETVGTISQSK